MKINVFLEKENSHKSVDVPKGQTIESMLKKMGINPQTVIVARNGEVVTEQEALQEGDSLKIVRFK